MSVTKQVFMNKVHCGEDPQQVISLRTLELFSFRSIGFVPWVRHSKVRLVLLPLTLLFPGLAHACVGLVCSFSPGSLS